MSTIFSKRFAKKLLQEDMAPMPAAAIPQDDQNNGGSDQAAFAGTLDTGTDADSFNDIEGAAGALQGVQDAEHQTQIETITSWIGKIGDITDWLNGLEGNSVQQQLKDSPCDTLLDNVSKSETKKITRIAQELSALKEALKGYILTSDDQTSGVGNNGGPGANLARQGPQNV